MTRPKKGSARNPYKPHEAVAQAKKRGHDQIKRDKRRCSCCCLRFADLVLLAAIVYAYVPEGTFASGPSFLNGQRPPQSMSAIVLMHAGVPEVQTDVPVPVVGPDELLIKVQAAPVNPSDVAHLAGKYYNDKYPAPTGFEGSGIVVAAGDGIIGCTYGRLMLGQRVAFAKEEGGSWAQYAAVDALEAFPLPADVGIDEGSAAIVNPMTVVGMLAQAHSDGAAAIVHTAAASQLGQMLQRMSSSGRIGVPLINVVRRDEQKQQLVALGAAADDVLLSTSSDFEVTLKSRLKHHVPTGGLAVALDAVSGDSTGVLAAALPDQSNIYVYGALSGKAVQGIRPHDLFRGINVRGFHLSKWLESGALEGLPRKLYAVIRARALLANELSTRFGHTVTFSNAVEAMSDYRAHKQGKMTGQKLVIQPWA